MPFKLLIPASEKFNYDTNEFFETKEQEIQIEHSLVSISKWESKHLKPFLSKKPKTRDETLDYIRCMTLTQNVDPKTYLAITEKNIKDATEYINAPMTATTFRKGSSSPKNDVITSEIIYYWMIVNGIPMECQKWHLNRLLTLIQVCNVKNGPQKKMSQREIMRQNSALNEARLAKYRTRG